MITGSVLFASLPARADADPVQVLFVKNGYYQQEDDILDHLNDLGCYEVTTKKDYQIYGSTDLSPYDMIIITEFAPGIGYYGLQNIENSGKPVLIVEYWDLWYSYKLGLVDDDWAGYYGTDTVEVVEDQNPIAFTFGEEIEIYSSSYTVYGAPWYSIEDGVMPLVYSSAGFNEVAVYFDNDRKIAATGIYDTTRYTDDAWALFDLLLNMVYPASDEEVFPPDGFTEQEWLQFLMDSMWGAPVHVYGGMKMMLVGLDEPLHYSGDFPLIEEIYLTQEQMDELGVKPGDLAEGSTPLHPKMYVQKYPDFVDSVEFLETVPVHCGDKYDPLCSTWSDTIEDVTPVAQGSGLQFGKPSYIKIIGCQNGQWSDPYDSYVTFSNGGQKGVQHQSEDFDLEVPTLDCGSGTKPATTILGLTMKYKIGGVSHKIWLVASAYKWLTLGEDAWDNIILNFLYEEGETATIRMDQAIVVHNGETITPNQQLSPPNVLGDGNYGRDLTPELTEFKQSLIHADSDWKWSGYKPVPEAVKSAVNDYAQCAHKQYPVFPTVLFYPPPAPYVDPMRKPHAWCSEFASSVLLDEDPTLATLSYPIPSPTPTTSNIGFRGFFQWLNDPSTPDLRYFGDDDGIDNGADDTQWSQLGTELEPGDYAAWQQRNAANTDWARGHSMIFIGWVDQLGAWTHIGPAYFNPNRRWNYMLQVSGNYWRRGSPVAIVGLDVVTVCKDPDYIPTGGGLVPVDPQNLPAGVECNLRLWDTHEGNQVMEGGFFGLIH